jgi:hypothetical protein
MEKPYTEICAPAEWAGFEKLRGHYAAAYKETVLTVMEERQAVDEFCEELRRGWNVPAIFRRGLRVAELQVKRADALGRLDAMAVILNDASKRLAVQARNN